MKSSYIIALLIAAGIVTWMLSGQIGLLGGDGPEDKPAPAAEETRFAVQARIFRAKERKADLILRGRTEALRTVQVKSETTARVMALPATEGGAVKEDDLLCELDVRDRELRVEEAEASVRQREMEYNAAKKLSGQGFRSETQTAGAEAAFDTAKAALKAAQIDLANTKIKAPFDGILDTYGVEVGELMQVGNVCAVIVDQNPFLVVTQVSEREVGVIELGGDASAQLASGEKVTGTVRLIATRADPATRTFRVEIEVANETGYLRDGVTAEIAIPVKSVEAHLISPAYLTLNTDGKLGVRTLENQREVRFMPVKIIEDTGAGVWVTGLPPQVVIVTVGQEFVTDGQEVTANIIGENGLRSGTTLKLRSADATVN